MPTLRAFHYSFHVKDLASTRAFYAGLLGCQEGRSTETWVDFDFWGNQLSCHLGPLSATTDTGLVDGIAVAMPHFGAILSWDEFAALAQRLEAAGTRFVLTPRVRYPGAPGEQATMFLLDPSGNALEFKAFSHPGHVFTA
jgi:uncharacterized protein